MPRAQHGKLVLQIVLLAAVMVSCEAKSPPSASSAVEPAPSPEVPAASARPMMIVFSRDYCPPCRVMKPWVTEIAEEHTAIDVVSVNVDRRKYEHFGRFFQITAVPTLVFADATGRVSARREGLATKKQMAGTLRKLGWVD